MFSWVNKQLENLSETLAPPPSTPTHAYLAALASHDESTAFAILNNHAEPFDIYAPLNNRGMSAIHVAASGGSVHLVNELVKQRGVRVDLTDYQGWSSLHHAAASGSIPPAQALAMVKVLVEECHASVLLKNASAQTAYDVASSQAVRGYLLPKQLQLETQECLDNGGRGLAPGIDLGGMKVNYNVAPPPTMMGGPPPPMSGGGMPVPGTPSSSGGNTNYNDPSAALMQPPPVRGLASPAGNAATVAPPMMVQPPVMTSFQGGAYGSEQQQTQPQLMQPPVASLSPATTQQPTIQTLQQPVQHHQPSEQQQQQLQSQQPITQPPKSNNSVTTPRSPSSSNSTSSGYALRGGNSNAASVLDEKYYAASGRRMYKPDGFHSSSNDKELQAKYGHVENDFERSRKLAMPPPPVSGGGAPIVGANAASGGPPTSGGINPYSALGAVGGNTRALGYIGGSGRARYPTYCAVSDSVSAPPSLGGMGGQQQYGGAAVPSYTTFSPSPSANSFNTANDGGAGVAPAVGQTQQWSGDVSQMQTNAYDGYQTSNTGGYDQPQQSGGYNNNDQWSNNNASSQPSAYNTFSPHPANYVSTGFEQQPTQQYSQQQQTYTPSPQHPLQQNEQTDAAAMFSTPHADSSKKQIPPSSGNNAANLQSPPIDAAHAYETFAASTPAKNDAVSAADHFSSPSAADSSAEANASAADHFASPPTISVTPSNASASDHFASPPPPADTNIAPNASPSVEASSADYFASSQRTTSEPQISASRSVAIAPAVTTDANSFFGSPPAVSEHFGRAETNATLTNVTEGQQSVSVSTITTAATSSADLPRKSFGGLPPPPVIGSSVTHATTATASRSFLPAPPVANAISSVPTSSGVLEDDDDMPADLLSDVSLNDS